MATLTIKNIPDDLYEQLKQSAVQHRRSINSEVLVCIERSLISPKRSTAATLDRIRQLREKASEHLLTEREIEQAKSDGRP
ncbi:MAG: Arc family DNA-binding protein [Gloeobacterales cyanobacterium]